MSVQDDDDDYLSDKFLLATESSSTPKTYAQRRKEAARQAQIKNEKNRLKSRRQREEESRSEGLNKSLFERAKEEEQAGIGSKNKALSMMLKMGFKLGQSLGNPGGSSYPGNGESVIETVPPTAAPSLTDKSSSNDESLAVPVKKTGQISEPLPVLEWQGKQGIGLGKRARSPTAAERVAKMARMEEATTHRDYRDRARQEYEERRADGKLAPAQRTCETLDERAGKPFNVLWLNPSKPETFPSGLMEALEIGVLSSPGSTASHKNNMSVQERLRRQMLEDALQPVSDVELTSTSVSTHQQFPVDVLEEVTQFLRLEAQDRLRLVVSYLRETYAYCFWCGVEYEDQEDLENQCPGTEEDDHD